MTPAITKNMLKELQYGTVLVDVAVDQGGCFESSRPTNHDNPTYRVIKQKQKYADS